MYVNRAPTTQCLAACIVFRNGATSTTAGPWCDLRTPPPKRVVSVFFSFGQGERDASPPSLLPTLHCFPQKEVVGRDLEVEEEEEEWEGSVFADGGGGEKTGLSTQYTVA